MDLLDREGIDEVDGKYILGKEIGRVSFYTLFGLQSNIFHLAFGEGGNRKAICKIVQYQYRAELIPIAQELDNWRTVLPGAQNIAEFWGDVVHDVANFEVRIYSPRGVSVKSLIKIISAQNSRLFPYFAFRIALALARGVKSCHDKNILHLNIRPGNVTVMATVIPNELCWRAVARLSLEKEDAYGYSALIGFIGQDQSTSVVLADFSGSLALGDYGEVAGQLKIGRRRAPESLDIDGCLSKKTDIYSLGHTLYEIFTCQPLLPRPPMIDILKQYPVQARGLIERCVATDPRVRPDIDVVIATLIEISNIIESGPLSVVNIERYIHAELNRLGVYKDNRLSDRGDHVEYGIPTRDSRAIPELLPTQTRYRLAGEIARANVRANAALERESGRTLPEAGTQRSEEIRSGPLLQAEQQSSYNLQRREEIRNSSLWFDAGQRPGYNSQRKEERRGDARSEGGYQPWRNESWR